MPPSLLIDPVAPPNGAPHRRPPEPPERRSDQASGAGRPRRARLAALLIACGLAGGATSTGILAATGALDRSSPAAPAAAQTLTVRDAATTPGNTAALYAAAAPGVVDIAVKGSPGGGDASGTGFVIDRDGRIVTAAHVVDGASSVTVTFKDGTTRSARVLGSDDATDIAVIDVDTAGLSLHPLRLGDSGALRVGEAVAAIGDPFGYQRSFSTGVVSGLDRTIDAPNGFTVAHAVQTDTAVNPGNSGGPLLAAGGTVVGIVDQIATGGSAEQSSGVGFAVPSDLVAAELDDLVAGRTVSHAYIGVTTTDDAAGAALESIASGGPAAAAGLRVGDVVDRIDGRAIRGSSDVVAAIADHRAGDRIKVTLARGATVEVTLGAQPKAGVQRP